MNDEKTTEIELPKTAPSNIVRVDFAERRKGNRPSVTVRASAQAVPYTLRPQKGPASAVSAAEWSTPWWVRLAALVAILALSLFVL